VTSTGRRGFVGIDRRWLADPDLSDSALRLMLWLDSHTHEYLRCLNFTRTAEEMGWSRNRVKRTIDDLTELGLVSVEHERRTGGGTVARITLHHEVWSDGSRRTSATVHDGPAAVVHGDAPTTSNPTDEESNSGTPKPPASTDVQVVEKWEVFFNQFWEFYPRKIAKPAARRAMKKAWANSPPENIAEGTRRWVAFWQHTETEQQFIPHPSTFLNQERYNDPLPDVPAVKKKMSKAEEAIEKIRNRDQ